MDTRTTRSRSLSTQPLTCSSKKARRTRRWLRCKNKCRKKLPRTRVCLVKTRTSEKLLFLWRRSFRKKMVKSSAKRSSRSKPHSKIMQRANSSMRMAQCSSKKATSRLNKSM